MSIYTVNSALPTTDKIEDINSMILELEGLVGQAKFNKNELDQIFTDVVLDRKFLRNQNIGHTLTTYTGWSHFYAESGYSIWKFTPTTYTYNANNQLYFDDKLLTNKGNANSESATTFDKVWIFDGSSYIDNTTEAGTEGGTEFSIFSTTTGYLYIGLSSTFSGIKFEFQTRGSNYTNEIEYSSDDSGTAFTQLTANINSLVDNTNNFESDGAITWTIPDDFTSINVNGTSKYWIRISSTTTPVTTAEAYLIIPNNNVIGLLAMSSEQLANEDWLWCTYTSSIYVTIRNTGNQAYEGNYYLTSHSSTTNKQNFFVYNHTFSTDYQDSTYVQGAAGFGYMQPPVEDKDVTDPTSGLADGTRYLIIDGGSGSEFVGYDNYIAEYDSAGVGTWTFIAPAEGMLVYVKDEDRYYQYEGNSWEQLATSAGLGLDWQESVLDKNLTSPPGSPTENNRYIVSTGATGAWAYFVDYIAEYIDSGWIYTAPSEGMTAWVEDENKIYIYNGTTWVEFSVNLDHGSLLGLSDDDHTQYLLANGNRIMSGNLNMGLNKITQLADPTNSRDAATKSYVDTQMVIENLWDRASGGTTIVPYTPNDNVDLGSGNFTTTGTATITTIIGTTINALTLSSLSIGFKISGGTTNKILTLNDDITSSNLVDSASVPLSISSGNISLLYNSLNFELDSAQQLTIKESGIDHGSITGLADNDHTQYIKAIGGLPLTLVGQIISFNFDNTDFQISGNNLTIRDEAIDHGTTSGLLDNDHTQYLLASGLSLPLTVTSQIISLNYDSTDFQLNGNQLQISDGGINHSNLNNLSADTHTQYYNLSRLETWLNTIGLDRLNDVTIESGLTIIQFLGWDGSRWINKTPDHGLISGLADDDHTQYLTTTRADTWFLNKAFSSLNDVDVASGVSNRDLLKWNGSRWTNIAPNSAITRVVILKVIADDTTLTTGDGKMYFTVPPELNGMNLVDADAHVYTVSSSGLPTIQIHNLTDTNDMLATKITIDANEKDSSTAALPPIIDQAKDDVVTADELRVDVDIAGTSTAGLELRLTFQIP